MKTHPQEEPPGTLAWGAVERVCKRLSRPIRFSGICGTCAILLAGGCGTPGAPQPPSLKLPQPPTNLAASRSGEEVRLGWTMPRRATDRVLLSGDQRVVVCRATGADPCTPVATLLLAAAAPASYTDRLPAALTLGPPQLLRYTVLLQNRQHTGAGPSNVAYTVAGAGPPPILALTASAEARGIALRWEAAPAEAEAGTQRFKVEHLLRLHRVRLPAAGESGKPAKGQLQAGVAQPEEQTLELGSPGVEPVASMAGGWSRAEALDKDAELNRTYRYTVERVARLLLDGHTVEVASSGCPPVVVEARDHFPPAVPVDVEAVADAQGGAIDLSWTADTEADLAGYAVYRRIAGAGGATRISGAGPIAEPAWRDRTVQPGVRYAYSVSAIDASGNESARSTEAEEAMPPREP